MKILSYLEFFKNGEGYLRVRLFNHTVIFHLEYSGNDEDHLGVRLIDHTDKLTIVEK